MKRIRAVDLDEEFPPADGRERNGAASPFKKGRTKSGGRVKGTPNRTPRLLKDAIMNAMDMVGQDNRGKNGVDGYLARIAWRKPEVFVRLVEKLLPFQLTGANGGPVQMTYENKADILQRFRERGLPPPQSLLEAPVLDAEFSEVETDED